MFEEVRQILDNILGVAGNGFVERTNASGKNFEVCNGVAVDDRETQTCYKCVALNNTVFKNDNLPNYWHKNCKCRNRPTVLKQVKLDFPKKKITNYLFSNDNKRAMMHTMGYTAADGEEVYNLIAQAVKSKFMSGDYVLQDLNEHGQHFAIYVELDGKSLASGKKFRCHAGCVAWPKGKIKIATPLVKDREIGNEVVG